MSEYVRTIIEIVLLVGTGLFGMIWWFLREKVHRAEAHSARVEERLRSVELTQVGHAAEIKRFVEVAALIGELRAEFAVCYARREDIANVLSLIERMHDSISLVRADLARLGAVQGERDRGSAIERSPA